MSQGERSCSNFGHCRHVQPCNVDCKHYGYDGKSKPDSISKKAIKVEKEMLLKHNNKSIVLNPEITKELCSLVNKFTGKYDGDVRRARRKAKRLVFAKYFKGKKDYETA